MPLLSENERILVDRYGHCRLSALFYYFFKNPGTPVDKRPVIDFVRPPPAVLASACKLSSGVGPPPTPPKPPIPLTTSSVGQHNWGMKF